MDRRDEKRKHRLTYSGSTSAADNQQMVHEYRDATAPAGGPPALERGGSHERADSREKEHGRTVEGDRLRRQTPPADGVQGTSSPRMQSRGSNNTPTKHLTSTQSSSNRAHENSVRKQNLEKIRKDLQQFRGRERNSDPGFHPVGRETVDKKMLDELINSYGYSEVRVGVYVSGTFNTAGQYSIDATSLVLAGELATCVCPYGLS